jgi:AcrR family transcriptional regulator
MPDTPGLRERKKQRTRRAIEAAALRLFEERGFEGTTIDDIAAAAEIAPRTFFHYFPSKEDVVLSDYAIRLDRIVAALGRTPGGEPPWQGLRAAFLSVAADYEDERDQLLRRFRIISENPSVAARSLQLQAAWEDAVAEAVAGWLDVDVRQTIEPRLLAGAALAAMRASLARWLTDNGRSRVPDHVDSCFTLLGSGLAEVGER